MSETQPPPSQPQSPRTKVLVLGVAALAVVAGLGYVAWSARRPSPPVTVVAKAPAPAPGPVVVPASRPTRRWGQPASLPAARSPERVPRFAGHAPVVPPAPLPDGGPPRAGLTRNHIRMAQAQLHRAADVCVADALKTNPDLGLRMAVRYTLYVQGGEARAVNPRITKSLINDKSVESCILDKLRHTSFPIDASDGILHVAESFNFKHLKRTHISD